MLTIGHIINTVDATPASDLGRAQPVTLESMRIAREFAAPDLGVTLYAVQSQGEAPAALPDCFTRLRSLPRSVLDVRPFREKRRLPLISDILSALYANSTADYMIYTNVDIGLLPYFYRTVACLLQKGYDGFVINRRTIADCYHGTAQLPQMFAALGDSHKGYDCFVFRRDRYPQFQLGSTCVGAAWVGRALLANLVAWSSRFAEFRNLHVTFHVGDAQTWRDSRFADYQEHNREQYLELFGLLEAARGAFDPATRSYLLDAGDRRQMPERYCIGGPGL